MAYHPTALLVTKDQDLPTDLREAAEESDTPLWHRPKRGHELLTYLQYHLARTLARADHPARRVHGGLFDRRADHRRIAAPARANSRSN